MASPVADSYVCVSGGVIAGGRNYVLPTVALVGDSLTDQAYGYSPFYWGNGLNGGKLQMVANSGVYGNTVANVISRINNAYDNASPGISGLPALGRVIVRIGTNDARNGTTIASLSSSYTSLLNTLASYAQRVIILSVPPLDGAYVAQNPKTADYNAWLSSLAASNSSVFRFVDDCINVRDGSGNQITSLFIDGTHPNNAGVYQMGLDLAAALASDLASYPSPLSTSSSDVYPTQPQWITNHVNAGTGGTKGSNVTGTVANSVSVSVGGSSSAVCSIVAADGGDANQTPWQRVNPTTGSSGGNITVSFSTSGRTMTTSDPVAVEMMVEVRFNALDMSKCGEFKAYFQSGGTAEYISPKAHLAMGNATNQTKTAVLRHKLKRAGATTPSSMLAILSLTFGTAFASSIGTFDFRCFTIRG